jgi:hypothetical protein
LTQRIIKCLSDTYPDAQNAWEIADSLKAPYKSVYSTLTRLVNMNLVERVKGKPRGYFRLPDDVFLRTYANLRPVRLGGFRTMSDLLVHRVGLWGECPGLFHALLELGELLPLDLKNVKGAYRGKSINYGASVKLLADGAYFQRSCEPVPVSVLPFMAQDLVESVAFRTRGLKRPSSVQLHDCEVGNDYACDASFGSDGFQLLKVYFPRKRKKKARVHLQFSGLDLPVPLSVENSDSLSDWFNRKVGQTVRFLSSVLARRGINALPDTKPVGVMQNTVEKCVLQTNWRRGVVGRVFRNKVQSIVEDSFLTASQQTSCITSLAESWVCGEVLIQSGP